MSDVIPYTLKKIRARNLHLGHRWAHLPMLTRPPGDAWLQDTPQRVMSTARSARAAENAWHRWGGTENGHVLAVQDDRVVQISSPVVWPEDEVRVIGTLEKREGRWYLTRA